MEATAAAASLVRTRIHNLSPTLSQNKIKHGSKLCVSHACSLKPRQQCKGLNRMAAGCVALGGSGSVAELEKQLEEEEWLKMGDLREKCKKRKGMVELLECLEREAIMGDDEGKEPTDYNRRAQIFHKSSSVFQALKELTNK